MSPWSLPHRILFRFICCYFTMYCMPSDGMLNILSSVPLAEPLLKPWTLLVHAICPWIAIHVFHLSGQRTTYFLTGSGDTTLAWTEDLLYLAIALFATAIWSVLDRKRPDYRGLHPWFRLLIRYTLAFTLFSYGFAKVVPLQFQPPRLPKFVEPYGEFSPMGVLWNFMGSSLAYTVLAGSAEVLGGLLLLFRRTTSLGAMVSAGVMANVVALNFCYDVPVKLYSSHLLLMCVILLAPDARRLFDVLIRNRAVEPADPMAVTFDRRNARIAATACWVLLCGWTLFSEIGGTYSGYRRFYVDVKHVPVYGVYDVEAGNTLRWRKAWFLDQGFGFRDLDDKSLTYVGKFDTAARSLAMNNGKGALNWTAEDADHVRIEGTLDGRLVTARLVRIDPNTFLLNNRGFHWISEFPFNR